MRQFIVVSAAAVAALALEVGAVSAVTPVPGHYAGPTGQTAKTIAFELTGTQRVTAVAITYKLSCDNGQDVHDSLTAQPNAAVMSDGSFSYSSKTNGVAFELHGLFNNTRTEATGTFQVHRDQGGCDTGTVTWGAHGQGAPVAPPKPAATKPAPAPAAPGRYSGPTGQTGKTLGFVVFGKRVTAVTIHYKASCSGGKDVFGTLTARLYTLVKPNGTFSFFVRPTGTALEFHGRFDATHTAARGTFEVHTKDNCDSGTVTWSTRKR